MVLLIIQAFVIILIIQIIFSLFAAVFKTDKLTDLAYGSTFAIIVVLFYITKSSREIVPTILTILITIWGARLATYLFIRILKIKKDERFDKIRGDFVKFAMFWLFQAIAIWIILLPTLIVLTTEKTVTLSVIPIFGIILWILGFSIETVSDQQKFSFKNNPQNKDKFISAGLWKYSRHPNYFGEILIWWGIFLFCLPYLHNLTYLAIAGPIFITFILLFISGIPPLEKKADEKFKDDQSYQNYKKRTPVLIPLRI